MAVLYAAPSCWSSPRFDANPVFHRSPSAPPSSSLAFSLSLGALTLTPSRNPPPRPLRSLPASASSILQTPMSPSHTTTTHTTRHPPPLHRQPPKHQGPSSAGARSRKPRRSGASCRTTDTTATTESHLAAPPTTMKTTQTRLQAC